MSSGNRTTCEEQRTIEVEKGGKQVGMEENERNMFGKIRKHGKEHERKKGRKEAKGCACESGGGSLWAVEPMRG